MGPEKAKLESAGLPAGIQVCEAVKWKIVRRDLGEGNIMPRSEQSSGGPEPACLRSTGHKRPRISRASQVPKQSRPWSGEAQGLAACQEGSYLPGTAVRLGKRLLEVVPTPLWSGPPRHQQGAPPTLALPLPRSTRRLKVASAWGSSGGLRQILWELNLLLPRLCGILSLPGTQVSELLIFKPVWWRAVSFWAYF